MSHDATIHASLSYNRRCATTSNQLPAFRGPGLRTGLFLPQNARRDELTKQEDHEPCPPIPTLADYVGGQLDNDSAQQTWEHLQICEPCQQQAAQLAERRDADSRAAAWLTSASLLRRALNGEWDEVLHLYEPLISKWCQRGIEWTGRNGDLKGVPPIPDRDVADVRAEVVGSLASSLARFERRGEASFRKWLKTITCRRMIDYWRKHGEESAAVSLDEIQLHDLHESDEEAQGDSSELLERALRHIRDRVLAGNRQWQAFYGMVFEGQSSQETGADLGMTAAAVRMAKRRVLDCLKEMFDGFEDDPAWKKGEKDRDSS